MKQVNQSINSSGGVAQEQQTDSNGVTEKHAVRRANTKLSSE